MIVTFYIYFTTKIVLRLCSDDIWFLSRSCLDHVLFMVKYRCTIKRLIVRPKKMIPEWFGRTAGGLKRCTVLYPITVMSLQMESYWERQCHGTDWWLFYTFLSGTWFNSALDLPNYTTWCYQVFIKMQAKPSVGVRHVPIMYLQRVFIPPFISTEFQALLVKEVYQM